MHFARVLRHRSNLNSLRHPFWCSEHRQGVTGRRHVDNDAVILDGWANLAHPRGDFPENSDFIEPRRNVDQCSHHLVFKEDFVDPLKLQKVQHVLAEATLTAPECEIKPKPGGPWMMIDLFQAQKILEVGSLTRFDKERLSASLCSSQSQRGRYQRLSHSPLA